MASGPEKTLDARSGTILLFSYNVRVTPVHGAPDVSG
jgi:hypothetical protein